MEGPSILFSCYITRSLLGENFIPEHVFTYQLSGTLVVNDGKEEHTFREGSFRLSRRNNLAKYTKIPPENGEYKAVSVHLDQDFLQKFSKEYSYRAEKVSDAGSIITLDPNTMLVNYIESLKPYFNESKIENKDLLDVKSTEAVLILLKSNPELKNILFDFSDPGKIDLEAFMNRNFQFNVSLQRFAYLCGRSLTTFKRDFEKVFHTSPGRWLLTKRLEEAYYRIKQKEQRPSDVYLEVGFEDLSHFSYAFKKMYGISPNQVKRAGEL